jgi:non-ribosomal peptide synthetase-like protein
MTAARAGAASTSRPRQAAPSDTAGLLHELFETQVDLRPLAPALVCGELELSYAELEARANRLAHYLRRHGVAAGQLVGIYLERSHQPIVAILAALKAGVGYVPIDPVHPEERIRYIADESEIALLITETKLEAKATAAFSGTRILLDAEATAIDRESVRRLPPAESGASPDALAYVIYTSGTTGRPKGVMTEHRNAYRFVLAFNDVCTTTPDDRVYQGFALGFDGSVEEIWMAFSNGAALIAGTACTPKFGDDAARFLAESRVTYLSTVPTMLSTMTEDVPSLRQLVVSGEACPPELVSRWARAGRVMLNVYGPTEATVNTTAFECRAGRRVTIGKPLPGYTAHILDEALRPVPAGTKGELFVGGVGVARGYLKRPDLTEAAFVTSPHVPGGAAARLYRTGDLVRVNDDGELEFFGRIDGQVKIRGYRVELSEIEAVLLEWPQVTTAAARVHERDGLQEIAAYVLLEGGAAAEPLDRSGVLALLKSRMPDYMIPAYLDVLPELPLLVSGKADRKRLPTPVAPLLRSEGVIVAPATPLEERIAAIWRRLFSLPAVSVEADFFLDLGGHSLLAAQVATALRADADALAAIGAEVAVRDVYRFPTVRKLAAELATRAEPVDARGAAEPASPIAAPATVSERMRILVVALQALSTYLIGALAAIPAALLVLVAMHVAQGSLSLAQGIAAGAVIAVVTWPAYLALAIAAKWLLVGRFREGAVPLWGLAYFRWWLAGRFQALSGANLLAGTPLLNVYLRLMGARIGRGCHIDTALFGAFDLIAIGDDSSIANDTQLLGYRVEDGRLHFGRVTLGRRCFVGIHSALGLGVEMRDGAKLDDQSYLPDGQIVPAGEGWRGSPARPGEVWIPRGDARPASPARHALIGAAQLALLHGLALALSLPALACLAAVVWTYLENGLAAAVGAAVASVPIGFIALALWIVVLKRVVIGRIRPGVHSRHGAYFLRQWLADELARAGRGLLLPLYTTMYLPAWLRLLGARIGARAEMSTVWQFSPDLLTVGPESFFADGCILGGKRLYGDLYEVRPNAIGRRSFVGNSSILPAGATLGDGCLLGVLSAPPEADVPAGTDWLGSPAFHLPNRQKVRSFDEAVTFKPTPKLLAQRAVVDACRILIPGYLGTALLVAGIAALWWTFAAAGIAATVLLAPLYALALSVAAILAVIALKWAVMGRFAPVVVPLWSPYVWLNEMVNGVYESIMAPALAPFLGTPFAAPFLRLIGCRIGRRVYLGSTLFSEFDLVRIDDDAALNAGAIVQTHLFEDRVMKSSRLIVGPGATVGNMAVVLYDAELQAGAWLGPMSLLMKGETLSARERWHGIPTVRESRPHRHASKERS